MPLTVLFELVALSHCLHQSAEDLSSFFSAPGGSVQALDLCLVIGIHSAASSSRCAKHCVVLYITIHVENSKSKCIEISRKELAVACATEQYYAQ